MNPEAPFDPEALLSSYLRGCCDRTLFDDFLMSALDAAVPRHQRSYIPMHVRKELHLKMAADGRELHGENGAPGHFTLHLLEDLEDLIITVDL